MKETRGWEIVMVLILCGLIILLSSSNNSLNKAIAAHKGIRDRTEVMLVSCKDIRKTNMLLTKNNTKLKQALAVHQYRKNKLTRRRRR